MGFRLAEAGIITNKNLIPEDNPEDWDRPSGLRIGTIEITRLGRMEDDMPAIAGFCERVLVKPFLCFGGPFSGRSQTDQPET